MAVAWLVWPIVVLVGVLVQAIRRVLRRWRLILLSFLVSLPCWFVLLLTLWLFTDSNTLNSPLMGFEFTVLWWRRLGYLRVARLLPDGWTNKPPISWERTGGPTYGWRPPTVSDIFSGFLHVTLAASLTTVSIIIVVLFLRAIVASVEQLFLPFTEESPS